MSHNFKIHRDKDIPFWRKRELERQSPQLDAAAEAERERDRQKTALRRAVEDLIERQRSRDPLFD